jgi:hypothetical protein
MCREAKEIQELKPTINGMDICNGEYFAVEFSSNNYIPMMIHFDGGEDEKIEEEYIWLPMQDQLQEMVDFSPSLGGLFDLDQFYRYQCHGLGYSMGQLWLAFVMDKKFGKRWSGESWIEASK